MKFYLRMRPKVNTESKKLNVPGAGSYEIKTLIGKDAVSKTMGSKLNLKPLDGVLGPGPGGYDVDKVKKGNLRYS